MTQPDLRTVSAFTRLHFLNELIDVDAFTSVGLLHVYRLVQDPALCQLGTRTADVLAAQRESLAAKIAAKLAAYGVETTELDALSPIVQVPDTLADLFGGDV